MLNNLEEHKGRHHIEQKGNYVSWEKTFDKANDLQTCSGQRNRITF